MGNCFSLFKPKRKRVWTFQQPRPQTFTLPTPLLCYIMKNPKVWNKLLATCKYFYSKYPFYASSSLAYMHDMGMEGKKHETFAIEDEIAKLWLYGSFSAFSPNKIMVSAIIPKLYKCELKVLAIFDQHISWNEYHFLTCAGTLKLLSSVNCYITYEDGAFVTMDMLIANQPNLGNLRMVIHQTPLVFGPGTTEKVIQILRNLTDLKELSFVGCKETFDLAIFIDYLVEDKGINFHLIYNILLDFDDKGLLKDIIEKVYAYRPAKEPFANYREHNVNVSHGKRSESLQWFISYFP